MYKFVASLLVIGVLLLAPMVALADAPGTASWAAESVPAGTSVVAFDTWAHALAVHYISLVGGTPYDFLEPTTADNNGNGMLDAIEFAVVTAICTDTGHSLHDTVHNAWKANVARLSTGTSTNAGDLGSLAASLAPPLKYVYAAYALLGDGGYTSMTISSVRYGWNFHGSIGILAETIAGMGAYGSGWSSGAPDVANYSLLPDLAGACGDWDGDTVLNINEFYGQGGPEDPDIRAKYVAAVLAAGTTASAEDPNDVCAGEEEVGLAWGVNLFYNTTTRYVYTMSPTNAPWPVNEYFAQNLFTVGPAKVAVAGHLATINSADLNAWIVATIMPSVGETIWTGGTDQATEGNWKWIASGVQFWSGKGSGLTPPGFPVPPGGYSNWNGGPADPPQSATTEPNDSGGEDSCEMNTAGGWNDNGSDTNNPGLIEFSNGGAGYADADENGYPDWWETYVPVPGGPTAAFSAAPLSGMQPLTVNFNSDESDPGEGDTIASWAWDFGDGGTSTLQNPTYIFEDFVGSPFTVTLTVTTVADLTDTETKIGYISVEESQYGASISQEGSPWLEVGDLLSLTVTLTAAWVDPTYEWKDGDLTVATTATYEIELTDLNIGTHSFTCVVSDASKTEFVAGPYIVTVFPEGSLPVAGIVGLALLAGAAILGARFSMRKK